MPLRIDGMRFPARWAEKVNCRAARFTDNCARRSDSIKIALINNMPDSALEDTESQFLELINAAAYDIPVHIMFYSLPNLPRTERGLQHLRDFYCDIKELLNSRFDGVIVTGTEPQRADLREEPYWGVLAELLDWAEENTASTVLSCLAAHAAVLHTDGIGRHRLSDKRFGVFEDRKTCDHALTRRTSDTMPFPHSRWNELEEDALTSCGYTVLTKSAQAGVNLFVKKKKRSLFAHFQGHPEYGAQTLLKEYRRDVRRYLRRDRETYPVMPHGYFDATKTEVLEQFRERALLNRTEELLAAFPVSFTGDESLGTWHSSATRVYRNWINYLAFSKGEASTFAVAARAGTGAFSTHPHQKRSAAS
jgi:homoserine O-succinyltransferase/O-acetyltransferase